MKENYDIKKAVISAVAGAGLVALLTLGMGCSHLNPNYNLTEAQKDSRKLKQLQAKNKHDATHTKGPYYRFKDFVPIPFPSDKK